jgi:hypothetical protein
VDGAPRRVLYRAAEFHPTPQHHALPFRDGSWVGERIPHQALESSPNARNVVHRRIPEVVRFGTERRHDHRRSGDTSRGLRTKLGYSLEESAARLR